MKKPGKWKRRCSSTFPVLRSPLSHHTSVQSKGTHSSSTPLQHQTVAASYLLLLLPPSELNQPSSSPHSQRSKTTQSVFCPRRRVYTPSSPSTEHRIKRLRVKLTRTNSVEEEYRTRIVVFKTLQKLVVSRARTHVFSPTPSLANEPTVYSRWELILRPADGVMWLLSYSYLLCVHSIEPRISCTSILNSFYAITRNRTWDWSLTKESWTCCL